MEVLILDLGQAPLRVVVALLDSAPDETELTEPLDALRMTWSPRLSHFAVARAHCHGIPGGRPPPPRCRPSSWARACIAGSSGKTARPQARRSGWC